MKAIVWLGIAVALAAGAPAAAKKDDGPPAAPVLAAADRTVGGGGRIVLANLFQREIETNIVVAPVSPAFYSGGYQSWTWLGSIYADNDNVSAARAQTAADRDAAPVRKALEDFDADALVLATTKAALAKPAWFQARDVAGSTDFFAISKAEFLARNSAEQMAFIRYRYDLSPGFTEIRAFALISIERQPVGADGKPAGAPRAIYRQNIMSIVKLRNASYDVRENAKRWSADHGKLAKAALTEAFGQLEQLIPYTLGLTQAEFTAFTDKKSAKAFAGGFFGTLIARNPTNPDDVTIWDHGLIHTQPIG